MIGPAIRAEILNAGRAFDLQIDDTAAAQLGVYIDTLLFWRTRMSLTAATSAAQIVREHIADSFAVVACIPRAAHVADVGSGAGFPGVPISIVKPDTHVTLIESRRKRASFLREAIRQSKIANAEVFETRVESFTPQRPLDVVTSRAFGSLGEFLDASRMLLRPGGMAVAMKGPKAELETASHYAGFGKPVLSRYSLGDLGHRTLVQYTRV